MVVAGAGLLGPGVASWVDQQHHNRLAGMWQDTVTAVQPGGRDGGVQVHLGSGAPVHADLVLVALGVVPDVGWLAASGLETAQGVVTDDRLRVPGAPGTYAAGDVARGGGGPKGEHWGHALAQGAHAARTIAYDLGLGEDPGPWAGSGSFATRLYGTPIAVLGTLTGHRSDLLGGSTDELHVSAATLAGALHGAVVRGPMKMANRLRPLVAARAPLADAVAVLEELTSTGRRRAS